MDREYRPQYRRVDTTPNYHLAKCHYAKYHLAKYITTNPTTPNAITPNLITQCWQLTADSDSWGFKSFKGFDGFWELWRF